MLKTDENRPLLKNEQDTLYFREDGVIVCPGVSCQDLQDADWLIEYPKSEIKQKQIAITPGIVRFTF